MKLSVVIFLAFIIIGCGSGTGSSHTDILNPVPTPKPTPTNFLLTVESHNSSNYGKKSDTPYYLAIEVTNMDESQGKIKNISLDNLENFTIESEPLLYPSNKTICTNGISLEPISSCEILLKLVTPTSPDTAYSLLTLTDDSGKTYKKTISKLVYAYIAGNFSSTYNTNPVINSNTSHTDSYCGTNGDADCVILEYDIANNTVTNLAQTNYNVNSMTVDSDGILYAGGGFNKVYSSNNKIEAKTSDSLATMILTINPSINSNITDFMDSISEPNYPDGDIYSIGFNSEKLYIAGGFQNIANLKSNFYPLISYSFKNNSWQSAFGSDINSPDSGITTLAFDNANNLYISGFYSTVSEFKNLLPANYYSINKCMITKESQYICGNSNTDYIYINSGKSFQPASIISFDNNQNLFSAGGFTQIISGLNIFGGIDDYIVAKFPNIVNSSANWIPTTYSQSPTLAADRPIGILSPLNSDTGYYIGGWFSTIGGLGVNYSEKGQCGPSSNIFRNGSNSCMLALYNAISKTWTKVFTTDGIINTFVISAKIVAQ